MTDAGVADTIGIMSQIQIDPNHVIGALQQQVADLAFEKATKDAVITALQTEIARLEGEAAQSNLELAERRAADSATE